MLQLGRLVKPIPHRYVNAAADAGYQGSRLPRRFSSDGTRAHLRTNDALIVTHAAGDNRSRSNVGSIVSLLFQIMNIGDCNSLAI